MLLAYLFLADLLKYLFEFSRICAHKLTSAKLRFKTVQLFLLNLSKAIEIHIFYTLFEFGGSFSLKSIFLILQCFINFDKRLRVSFPYFHLQLIFRVYL
jgi:hypothetical protein